MRPLTVSDARNTFLLRSSGVFYPQGIPSDPAVLPDLTKMELAEIEKILAASLGRVITTQTKHRPLLMQRFPRFDDGRARVKLEILSQASAVAATEETGRVFVDAKVVQAIYRSALLSVLVEREDPEKDREKLAFERFAEFVENLGKMSSVQPLADVRGFMRGVREVDGSTSDNLMAGAWGMLEARLRDMVLAAQSRRLESSFLEAIEFMLAHETGHLVLGHFPLAVDCGEAQKRELDADGYAVVVNGLAQFDGLPTLSLKPKGAGWEVQGGGLQALWGNGPTGYQAFFQHAYGLAGFHRVITSIPNCSYPSPEERQKAISVISVLAGQAVTDAKYHHALARMNGTPTDADAAFESFFDRALKTDPTYGGATPDQVHANREFLKALHHLYYRK